VPVKASKRRRLGDSTVPRQTAQGRASQPRLGTRRPARRDRRRPRAEVPQHSSMSSPARPWRSRSIAQSTPMRQSSCLATERGTPANVHADNRPDLTSLGAARVVSARQDRYRLHRTGLALAERLRGVLQRRPARRAVERRGLRNTGRGPGAGRRLATDYDANHPHSALGMMSPARFAASRHESAKRLSQPPDPHSG
jgi:hypothetical protein